MQLRKSVGGGAGTVNACLAGPADSKHARLKLYAKEIGVPRCQSLFSSPTGSSPPNANGVLLAERGGAGTVESDGGASDEACGGDNVITSLRGLESDVSGRSWGLAPGSKGSGRGVLRPPVDPAAGWQGMALVRERALRRAFPAGLVGPERPSRGPGPAGLPACRRASARCRPAGW